VLFEELKLFFTVPQDLPFLEFFFIPVFLGASEFIKAESENFSVLACYKFYWLRFKFAWLLEILFIELLLQLLVGTTCEEKTFFLP
jgi:hypothetical protein